MTIERLAVEDAGALAILYEELLEVKTDVEALKKNLMEIAKRSEYYLIGAKDTQGHLVGTIIGILCIDTIGACDPYLLLENFVVSEKVRGQGIGKALISHMEDHAREKGCDFAMLVTAAWREKAHEFYRRCGYEENKGFKKYFKK